MQLKLPFRSLLFYAIKREIFSDHNFDLYIRLLFYKYIEHCGEIYRILMTYVSVQFIYHDTKLYHYAKFDKPRDCIGRKMLTKLMHVKRSTN